MTQPMIVTQRKQLQIVQKPGVGPPGTIEGGFSVNGKPPFYFVASISGSLVVASGIHRLYAGRPGTIGHVDLSLGQTPAGDDVIFDVNLNGTTIFTTQSNRPTVTAGTNASLNNVPDVTGFTDGDFFTIDCDQRGSTAWGGAATIMIWYF